MTDTRMLLDVLSMNRHGLTVGKLQELTRYSTGALAARLFDAERQRQVYLSRDTTHDHRLGGIELLDGTWCVRAVLRTPEV